MAKLVYVCLRNPSDAGRNDVLSRIEALSRRIVPDNLPSSRTVTNVDDGVICGVISHTNAVTTAGINVCLGKAVDRTDWQRCGAAAPDGVYLIARSDSDSVQVVTDATASRTAWIYCDERIFIASSSQRAIALLTGIFRFNPDVVPWLVCTGSIGPGAGWDADYRRVAPLSTVTLDRREWRLTIDTRPLPSVPVAAEGTDRERELITALRRSIGRFDFDLDRWILPLSGGADSRGLLYLLATRENRPKLRTITWANRASLDDPESDSTIARRVAEAVGVAHRIHLIDPAPHDIEAVFERFIVCGEGCIDHVSGYSDGFTLWKSLYDSGVGGVIRGDQLFGGKPVATEADVWHSMGIWKWNEFDNLPAAPGREVGEPHVPPHLHRCADESLEDWRDRIRQQFRLPVFIAALNELKTAYVEIISPFLAADVVAHMLSIPAEMRTAKALYHSLFDNERALFGLEHSIPFARYRAISEAGDFLGRDDAVALFRRQLSKKEVHEFIPAELVEFVLQNIRTSRVRRRRWKKLARRIVSSTAPFLLGRLKTPKRPFLNPNVVAFRLLMILRMRELLEDDARSGQ